MRKKLLIIAMLACLAMFPVFSEGLSFTAYLDAYMAAFTDITDAQDLYKEAALAYEGAVARSASAIELEILLSAKERKALDIKDTVNQAAIDAFTLYAQYQEQEKALALASDRLAEAEATIKNDESQFSLGLISETEYLTRKLSLYSAMANQTAARRSLEDAERKIARMIGNKPIFSEAPSLDTSAILQSLAPVALDTARASNAELYSAKANLSINEKIWKVISISTYANELEKKDAAEKFKAAKKTYKKTLESIEDRCVALERSIADLVRQYEKFGITSRITEIGAESAELKKNYGKATELELSKVRSDRQARIDEMEQFNNKLVQKRLELLKLANGDCAAYLKETMK